MEERIIKIIPLAYKSYNYGGTLQYFALQEAIKGLGYGCSVLDLEAVGKPLFSYHQISAYYKEDNIAKKICTKIINKLQNKKWQTIKPDFSSRNAKFDLFRERRIACERYSADTIDTVDATTLMYVCGSDQIWNPYYASTVHFFTFASPKIVKMIYGASIGAKSLPDFVIEKYNRLLADTNYISVREKDAIAIANQLAPDKEIALVVDPVFLVDQDYWRKMCEEVEQDNTKNSIFTYFMGETVTQRKIAKRISLKLRKRLVNIPYPSERYVLGEGFADIDQLDAGPIDFVCDINSSEMVLTDSFHAAAFCILLHKDFYVLDRDAGKGSMLSRIYTLLSYFGLERRLISSVDQVDKTDCIQWNEVDSRIVELKNKSFEYLLEGINNALGKDNE